MRSFLLLAVLVWATWAPPASAQSAARQAGYLYLSPLPSASYVSPQNHYFLVRFTQASPSAITNLLSGFITVAGDISGPHSGVTKVATDGRTVIFQTGTDFVANEFVTVTLNPSTSQSGAGAPMAYSYQFMVAGPYPGSYPLALSPPATPIEPPASAPAPAVQRPASAKLAKGGIAPKVKVFANGVSVPSDFPTVVISANNNPSPGYLFLENGLDGAPPYTMMLDNSGQPVWYRRGRMYDFKIQQNGLITWCLSDATGFPAFDQNFNYVRTYLTTNGYLTDGHELKVLADGRYFMIGYQTNAVDMSHYVAGNNTITIVRETAVQGFTPAGELIFQWRAWDNYNLGDLGGNADFPHLNGLDIDEDGNLLVSSRHFSEVDKVDLDSGDLIWRLSGTRSTFRFVNDPFFGMSFQHDISALGHGHYMVFDNGDTHTPLTSRAVEYLLDLTNKTATMVWQFRDTPDKYTYWMGSAQRLPTGNTLIDFVLTGYPKAIEVDSNGVKRFELSLVPGADSYRAFRLPWNGVVAAPYLVTESQGDGVTLIYNKFGDNDVAYYRIYAGSAPNPDALVAESTSTLQTISNLVNGVHYFRVTAVNSEGVESPSSNEQSVNVHVIRPGENMVANGDFSLGKSSWSFSQADPGMAGWAVVTGYVHVAIADGGTTLPGIQLLQTGLNLSLGSTYVLQFDAWASNSRYIQPEVIQDGAPFADHSRFPPAFITPNRTHFSFSFVMKDPTDPSADLAFNLGGATGDFYLTNVRLFNPAPGDFNLDGHVDLLDLNAFGSAWLNAHGGSPVDLDGNGLVNFKDFNIFGNSWGTGGQ